MTNLTNSETEIRIDKPADDFLQHLKSNKRILFSSAFGTGKTFFLDHFFNAKQISEKYNVFHLFPINYQIATNEDIFELIKYDILFHLLGVDWINIDIKKLSKSLVAQTYLMNNGVSIISKIMKCIPIIDKVGKAIETLIDIQKDFTKYYEDINKDDVTLLTDFYKQFKQKKGSYLEFDAISEFIYDNLVNCNNGLAEEKHKENVLIIDDLDRIDPEHIFRLLNVFSAHFDINKEDTNKFGFDKIIFVCDVENIKCIFAAKYGQNTDFSGYIDKFYSSVIFHFDNKSAIIEFIKPIMFQCNNLSKYKHTNYYAIEIGCISDILVLFIERSAISLRQIIANVKMLTTNKKEGVGYIGEYHYYFIGYTILWVCFKLFGGQKDNLLNAIKKAMLLSDNKSNILDVNLLASVILPLTIIDTSSFDNIDDVSIRLDNIEYKLKIDRETDDMHYYKMIYAQLDTSTSISFETLQHIFIEAVNKLYHKGLLN